MEKEPQTVPKVDIQESQNSNDSSQVETESTSERYEPSMFGQEILKKEQTLSETEQLMDNLPEDPLQRAAALDRVKDFLNDELKSSFVMDKQIASEALYYGGSRELKERYRKLNESYLSAHKEISESLHGHSYDEKTWQSWKNTLDEGKQKAAATEQKIEEERAKVEARLRQLKKEKSGFFSKRKNRELLEKLDRVLSELRENRYDDLLAEDETEIVLARLELERQLGAAAGSKELVERGEAILTRLRNKWEEKTRTAEENLAVTLRDYKELLKQCLKADEAEFEKRAFLESKVFSGLEISQEDEERYVPQNQLESELGDYELRRSFKNIREMLREYFRYLHNPPEGWGPSGFQFEEIAAGLQEQVAETEKSIRCELNTTEEKLKKILAAGKFKSFWEMNEREQSENAKPGLFSTISMYIHERKTIERKLKTVGKLPIYAALSSDNEFDLRNGPAPSYGDLIIEFQPETLERSRFVLGDGMNGINSLIEPFNPHFLQSKWHDFEKRILIKKHALLAKAMLNHYFGHVESRPMQKSLHYVETHVLDGVSLGDVKKVKVSGKLDEETTRQLEEKSIAVEYIHN